MYAFLTFVAFMLESLLKRPHNCILWEEPVRQINGLHRFEYSGWAVRKAAKSPLIESGGPSSTWVVSSSISSSIMPRARRSTAMTGVLIWIDDAEAHLIIAVRGDALDRTEEELTEPRDHRSGALANRAGRRPQQRPRRRPWGWRDAASVPSGKSRDFLRLQGMTRGRNRGTSIDDEPKENACL
jgi:hypothetical protein